MVMTTSQVHISWLLRTPDILTLLIYLQIRPVTQNYHVNIDTASRPASSLHTPTVSCAPSPEWWLIRDNVPGGAITKDISNIICAKSKCKSLGVVYKAWGDKLLKNFSLHFWTIWILDMNFPWIGKFPTFFFYFVGFPNQL